MAEQERLTARDPGGNAYLLECDGCGGNPCFCRCVHFDKVCEKLAGYEEREEEAEKLLAESEAARTELGKRLAAAEKELHEAKSDLDSAVRGQKTLQKEMAECKAERDAAVHDLHGECFACEHVDTDCPAMNCRNGEKFKWRGPQKEEKAT